MKCLPRLFVAVFVLVSSACTSGGAGQPEQTNATAVLDNSPLKVLYGRWVGTARGTAPNGQSFEITQTERVGPMLGGHATVIEGRGYAADGSLTFNAFAIAALDKRSGKWEMRSYTNGYAGTYDFAPTPTGFVWSIPAGPDAVQRFTATVVGDSWTQIGEYVPTVGEPRKTFEMNLQRVGDTDWPSAGFVGPDG